MAREGKKIAQTWTVDLAYAVGLLASDGCLSKNYLIDFTSKDREQVNNFIHSIGASLPIGEKRSGAGNKSFRAQFKNKDFYRFLVGIGITPAKSKTLGGVKVPAVLFWDFLRGVFDGDGSFYSYTDSRWRNSLMFYTIFASGSKRHIDWIRAEISRRTGALGHITKGNSVWQLKYAKRDSLLVLKKMYHQKEVICLTRKRLKIEKILRIVQSSL